MGVMIQIKNADFSKSGLGTVNLSADEIKIASLPNINYWFDMASKFAIPGQKSNFLVNRINGNRYGSANPPYQSDTLLNSKPGISYRPSPNNLGFVVPSGIVNLSSYTIICIMKVNSATIPSSGIMVRTGNGPAIIATTTTLNLKHGATNLMYTNFYALGELFIVTMEYDSATGILNIYKNGNLYATVTAQPVITDESVSFLSLADNTNDSLCMGDFMTLTGTLSSYADKFSYVHAYLKTKYGIS